MTRKLIITAIALVLLFSTACTSTTEVASLPGTADTQAAPDVLPAVVPTAAPDPEPQVELAAPAAEPVLDVVTDTAVDTAVEAAPETSASTLDVAGVNGVNPCAYVDPATVASVVGDNFYAIVSDNFDEIHCDIFPQGTPTIPDAFAITIAEVPADTIDFYFSSGDEQIQVNGVTGYIDNFGGSIVVPDRPTSDGTYGGFTVGVYGSDETVTERHAARLQLAIEVLAANR